MQNEIHSVYYESEVLLGWVIEEFGSKTLAQEYFMSRKQSRDEYQNPSPLAKL